MTGYRFATVRPAATILHMQVVGNRRASCGIVAEYFACTAAAADGFLTRRLCKNCARVNQARDTSRPADPKLSEPTDTWTVTDKYGDEITRVHGVTMAQARVEALKDSNVHDVSRRDGGFSLRRLTVGQLRATA